MWYDGSKKFETASYGVSTDGLLNFNGTGDKILIADDGKISFGGGGDFDIYHSGNANYLSGEVDGRDIYLRAEEIFIFNVVIILVDTLMLFTLIIMEIHVYLTLLIMMKSSEPKVME